MEWSIQQIAKLAGTTSRTLRHYGDVGLLQPTRVASNGYRYYDAGALVRLQRILLLRELGLGLPQIADVLEHDGAEEHALEGHLAWLREERHRLARQIASVESTIQALRGGEQLMAENMFDGFDHTQHRHEVEQRWGAGAYAKSDGWWRSMSAEEQSAWQQRAADLSRDWVTAAKAGVAIDGPEATALAERHVQWLTGIPGTPAATRADGMKGYVIGLGDLYAADPRFAGNYALGDGDTAGAEFVRDALRAYAEARL